MAKNAAFQARLVYFEGSLTASESKPLNDGEAIDVSDRARLTGAAVSDHACTLKITHGVKDSAGTFVPLYESTVAVAASAAGAAFSHEVLTDWVKVDLVNSSGGAAAVKCHIFGRAMS